jgi:hypothetical protein
MKELPLKLIFSNPEMCDLAPVLAIHTAAKYVNDLQLTLDKKLHAKLVFRFQKW